jgi:hypothetical protein
MQEMYVGLVLSMGPGLILVSSVPITSAQPLEKDYPTGNLTEDIDIAINPTEPLPPNGTVTMSTEGATDMDSNEFPPPGVTAIIQNDKIIVTNNPVAYE